jgi:hypothetical protein
MKVSIIATSDLLTKKFAEELFIQINNPNEETEYEFSVYDNFTNEVYESGIVFIIYLGGVFTEKIVEKIIDNIVDRTKDKIKKEEKYDMNITININIDNSFNSENYNIITDIEKLKKDLCKKKGR